MDSVVLLFSGLLMGAAAGFSPGPLMYLVIQESMAHGFWAGLKVAFSPLVTDIFIISALFFFLSFSFVQNTLLQKTIPGLLYLCGGIYLLILSRPNLLNVFSLRKKWGKTRKRELNAHTNNMPEENSTSQQEKSFRKGIIVNAFNPHAYLFWLTIGAPLLFVNKYNSFFFILGFYLMLISSKISIAYIVHRMRWFIYGKIYKWINIVLSWLLVAYAGYFIFQGWKSF